MDESCGNDREHTENIRQCQECFSLPLEFLQEVLPDDLALSRAGGSGMVGHPQTELL